MQHLLVFCFFTCPLYINYSILVKSFTWVAAQLQLDLPEEQFG